jgi:hypothetical protein
MWTEKLINEYLGDLNSFETLYCRKHTDSCHGTLQRAEGINSDCLRKIIFKLTKVLKYGAHASPSWNYANAKLPVIKIGIKYLDRIPGFFSCGLILIEKEGKKDLHFWIDKSFESHGYNYEDKRIWSEYTYNNKPAERYYYLKPLDCNSDFDDYINGLINGLSSAQQHAFNDYVKRKRKRGEFDNGTWTKEWVPRNAER